jgi:HEAT repeat protein
MATLSKNLQKALESDCAHDLEPVIKEKKRGDFQGLLKMLSLEPSIKPEHRARAIHILGRWGDPEVVAAIRNILPQLDETERIRAIDALGRLGSKEALAGVVEYVDDPSPHVRKFVVRALGRIDTKDARAKLKEVEAKDPTDFVRGLASKQLEAGQE